MKNPTSNLDQKPSLAGYQSPILSLVKETSDIFRMRLKNPAIATQSEPGQFLNIRVRDDILPLLRRPFSIYQTNKREGWIEILFKVIGRGTELLSRRRVGEKLDVLGPLGRGFEIKEGLELAVVVGGGLGIAPLLFLCQEVTERGIKTLFFYGVKTRTELCSLEGFSSLNAQIQVTTEDGTFGQKGLVTDLLEEFLQSQKNLRPNIEIFSCGPVQMLKKIKHLALASRAGCQLCLETMMACGIGICMGCPVEVKPKSPTDSKYRLVCKDGPVFRAEEVVLPD
ncbi:MAG: dihydroorotate dehydrogenase electron transfer subunit [candidate division KSB1 bacterium]|nr:dihydroorotate dehydrogenase electron transfer subunit [candidate division KSB1 bacterium]